MPIYKYFRVLEVGRGIKAFLRLQVGLTRGEVPNPEQKTHTEQKTHIIVGDVRDHYIGRLVRGKSFADVEGLYDTLGEKVSVAHSFGATTLTMIDTVPQDDKLWQSFSDRMRCFGVSEFDTISENTHDLINAPDHPRYDVVHCSGVLHRVPDPIRFLSALHKITREYLVLGSAVTATRANGREETPSVASLLVPALREREDPTREETWQAKGFASWGWLPTVDSLKAMCTSVGFNYEDGAYYEDSAYYNNAYVMLLSR